MLPIISTAPRGTWAQEHALSLARPGPAGQAQQSQMGLAGPLHAQQAAGRAGKGMPMPGQQCPLLPSPVVWRQVHIKHIAAARAVAHAAQDAGTKVVEGNL